MNEIYQTIYWTATLPFQDEHRIVSLTRIRALCLKQDLSMPFTDKWWVSLN